MTQQRGNILFLILLAIILFAALTYAVNSGTRGGGKDAGGEKAKSAASTIVNHSTLMQQTVNRLMLTNGCKESELSFEDTYDTGYTNNARADGSCKLFDPAGGGLEYPVPDESWLDPSWKSVEPAFYGKWFFFSAVCVNYLGGPGGCSGNGLLTDNDLVVFLPFVTKSVCQSINDSLGIPPRSDGNPVMNGGDVLDFGNLYKFRGAFSGWGSNVTFHLTPSAYNGNTATFYDKHYGCFEHSDSSSGPVSSNRFVFYQVLLVR